MTNLTNSTNHCHFCCQEITYSPLPEMIRHRIDIYFCHPCQVEYLYLQSNKLISISLYTEINSKTYRWTVNGGWENTLPNIAHLYWISKPGIPGKIKNEGLIPVIDLHSKYGDIIPIMTPSTVNKKIRTWLIFL